MSGFKRTASGLNNQHLFYNVDLIVFLEGGAKSYSKSEVYSGLYHEETEDIIFWRNMFDRFTKGKKIKFKSVGSKATIKEIAIDIINGKLETVFVAMDSEFDEILKTKIDSSNVFYTHGYSWENDCWNAEVLKAVIEELSAIRIKHSELKENFEAFLQKMKIAVCADGYLFKKSSSFFPRQTGFMFCIDCTPIDLPSVKKNEISNRIAARGLNKNTLYSFGRKFSISAHKFIFGHLLADYCCQVIIHYLKNRHNLIGIRKDIIYRMAINKFFLTSFDRGNIYEHYKAQFQKINA